ncbi:MAG TPA: hypothetical protein VN739_05415 [Nitrososphaerales archaeon]|nr:hypothetical protein [Nitrososphaerales archaeon]
MKAKLRGDQRPLLKVLNEFARSYLPVIKVRFGDGMQGGESGRSDLERKIIYLSTKQQLKADSISLGLSYAYRIGPKYRRMKLTKNEMYFLTLLHEIGHFKIKEKVPKSYHLLREELIRKHSHDHRVEFDHIERRIKQKTEETETAWKLRLADFETWLVIGESISHHIKVENWAIDEFEKKRAKIATNLKIVGL